MNEEELIYVVKQYEEIYNTKSSKYRDLTVRTAAWEEIAKVLQRPVEECKEHWYKLRNRFSSAMKRRERNAKAGPNGKIFPPWRFEEQMSFIKPHRVPHNNDEANGTRSPVLASPEHISLSPDPNSSYHIKEEETFIKSHRNSHIHDESNDSQSPLGLTSPEHVGLSPPPSSYIKETPSFYSDVIVSSKEKKRNTEELDEIDHFFLCMSKTVKKMPKIEQVRLKMDIHKVVNEAELNQLETEQNAKKTKYS